MQKKELSELIIIEFIVLFAVGLVLQGIYRALIFAVSYFVIFFLPGLPMHRRFEGFMLKFVMINLFGLIIIPISYFVINQLTRLTHFIFIAVPFFIFFLNLGIHRNHFFQKP